jgi:hypothetical protein
MDSKTYMDLTKFFNGEMDLTEFLKGDLLELKAKFKGFYDSCECNEAYLELDLRNETEKRIELKYKVAFAKESFYLSKALHSRTKNFLLAQINHLRSDIEFARCELEYLKEMKAQEESEYRLELEIQTYDLSVFEIQRASGWCGWKPTLLHTDDIEED